MDRMFGQYLQPAKSARHRPHCMHASELIRLFALCQKSSKIFVTPQTFLTHLTFLTLWICPARLQVVQQVPMVTLVLRNSCNNISITVRARG